MAAKSEILGVAELQRALRKLPEELRRNALNAVSRAGAQELQRAAYAQLAVAMRTRTPREEDVVIKKRRAPKEHVQAVHDVGPPRRKPQLRWLHTGVAPHEIRSSGVLADVRRNLFFGRRAQHPGQRATLWLQVAQHVSAGAVMREMAEKLMKALPQQVRRVASTKYTSRLVSRLAR